MAQMVAMESIDLSDTTVTIPAELPEEQIHIETAEERWIIMPIEDYNDRLAVKIETRVYQSNFSWVNTKYWDSVLCTVWQTYIVNSIMVISLVTALRFFLPADWYHRKYNKTTRESLFMERGLIELTQNTEICQLGLHFAISWYCLSNVHVILCTTS